MDIPFTKYLLEQLPEADPLSDEDEDNEPEEGSQEYITMLLYRNYDDDGVLRVKMIENVLKQLSSGFEKLRKTLNTFSNPEKVAFIKSKGWSMDTIWNNAWKFLDDVLDTFNEVLTTDAPTSFFIPLFMFLQDIWEECPDDDCIETGMIVRNLIVSTYGIVKANFADSKTVAMYELITDTVQEMMDSLITTRSYGLDKARDKKARVREEQRQKQIEVSERQRQKHIKAMARDIRRRKAKSELSKLPPPLPRSAPPSPGPN